MGQEVIILNRTLPVAKICPISRQEVEKRVKMPDFASRARAIFGDQKKAISNSVLDEREQSKW